MANETIPKPYILSPRTGGSYSTLKISARQLETDENGQYSIFKNTGSGEKTVENTARNFSMTSLATSGRLELALVTHRTSYVPHSHTNSYARQLFVLDAFLAFGNFARQ